LTKVIGAGAYDSEGHMLAQFWNAKYVGPYPEACKKAWTAAREEAMANMGMRDNPEQVK
jgi:hypothetical protein